MIPAMFGVLRALAAMEGGRFLPAVTIGAGVFGLRRGGGSVDWRDSGVTVAARDDTQAALLRVLAGGNRRSFVLWHVGHHGP